MWGYAVSGVKARSKARSVRPLGPGTTAKTMTSKCPRHEESSTSHHSLATTRGSFRKTPQPHAPRTSTRHLASDAACKTRCMRCRKSVW